MKKNPEPNEHKKESSKSKNRKRFWIATIISYGGTSIFTLFFFNAYFMRTLLYIVIFGMALIVAYYIRIRPSKKVNKLLYILLGTTTIGFGLCFLYALIGISRYLVNLQSWYIWLNLINLCILLMIGGYIGNFMGKKVDYRIPFSFK